MKSRASGLGLGLHEVPKAFAAAELGVGEGVGCDEDWGMVRTGGEVDVMNEPWGACEPPGMDLQSAFPCQM